RRGARVRRAAGRRGAPLRRHGTRGVAPRLGALGALHRDDRRQGRRRLPRGARATQGGARQVNGRFDAVLAAAAAKELDILLVTNVVNVRWLTGFTGSNALVLLGRRQRRFITD